LHLTPLTSEVKVAPQFNHLGAAKEVDALRRRDPGAAGDKDGAGGGAAAGPARAIHMTVKSADGGGADGSGLATETMADRMRAIALEPFRRIRFEPGDSDDAWRAYDEALRLRAAAPAADSGKGKGKSAAGTGAAAGSERLADWVPHLRTDWDFEAWLDYMNPERAEEKAKKAAEEKSTEDAGIAEPKKDEPAKKSRPGRPKGSSSARGGRGGKAKAAASRGEAMEID
jgi:DNA-directed RNA polymerase III subunit RPC5